MFISHKEDRFCATKTFLWSFAQEFFFCVFGPNNCLAWLIVWFYSTRKYFRFWAISWVFTLYRDKIIDLALWTVLSLCIDNLPSALCLLVCICNTVSGTSSTGTKSWLSFKLFAHVELLKTNMVHTQRNVIFWLLWV